MSDITIYHNPRCSKSRQTLALLESHNIQPNVIEYLKNPPTKEQLIHIVSLGIAIKDLIRTSEKEWQALSIDLNNASDDDLMDAILSAPKVMQRPIVIANGKAVLGRPPENVLEIL